MWRRKNVKSWVRLMHYNPLESERESGTRRMCTQNQEHPPSTQSPNPNVPSNIQLPPLLGRVRSRGEGRGTSHRCPPALRKRPQNLPWASMEDRGARESETTSTGIGRTTTWCFVVCGFSHSLTWCFSSRWQEVLWVWRPGRVNQSTLASLTVSGTSLWRHPRSVTSVIFHNSQISNLTNLNFKSDILQEIDENINTYLVDMKLHTGNVGQTIRCYPMIKMMFWSLWFNWLLIVGLICVWYWSSHLKFRSISQIDELSP